MKEPIGLLDRLHEGRPTADDIAYVEHRISVATDHTDLKLLRRLHGRLVPAGPHGKGAA